MFKKLENIKTYKDIPKKSKHQKEYNNYWDTWKCYAIKSKVCYHKHLFGRTALNIDNFFINEILNAKSSYFNVSRSLATGFSPINFQFNGGLIFLINKRFS